MDWDAKLWEGCFSFKLSEVTSQILRNKRRTKKGSLHGGSCSLYVTNSLKHSLSWEANSYSSIRDISPILWKPTFDYGAQKRRPRSLRWPTRPQSTASHPVSCGLHKVNFYPDIQWPLFSHIRKTISFPFLKFPHQYPHSPSGIRQKSLFRKALLIKLPASLRYDVTTIQLVTVRETWFYRQTAKAHGSTILTSWYCS